MPIDKDLCIECKKCVSVCPVTHSTKYIRFPSRCISCGNCIAVCPTKARSLDSVSEEANYLNTRRSIRNYKPETVNEKTILGLISETFTAPSPHNSMPTKWCVVSEPKLTELRTQLLDLYPTAFRISSELGNDPFFFSAPHLILAYTDPNTPFGKESAVIAMTYFELAAAHQQFGTCWAGHFLALGKSLLGIEEIHAAVAFGIPKYSYPNTINRTKDTEVLWI